MLNARKLFLFFVLVVFPVSAQNETSPGSSSAREAKAAARPFDARCMAGQWHEQIDNPFRWIFEVRGDKLQIERTDRFVAGKFRREGSSWKGELKWGNGETWRNVSLTPTSNCDEIRTNQGWWFKRRKFANRASGVSLSEAGQNPHAQKPAMSLC